MRQRKQNINWHAAMVAALRIDLRAYEGHLEYLPEFPLGKSKDSLKSDLLIIKRTDRIVIENPVAERFLSYNLIEYKSPADYFSVDDFYKLTAYGCLFKTSVRKVDGIPAGQITLTMICTRYPKSALKKLFAQGITVRMRKSGIYDVSGALFQMQIIVSRQIHAEDALWLKCLDNEIRDRNLFEKLESEYRKHGKEELYMTPMNAIIRSNYRREGNQAMWCEALYELFADELEEKYVAGQAQGRSEGIIEGKLEGKIEGRTETILEILSDKDDYTDSVKEVVTKEGDIETLKSWLRIAVRAESVAQFMQQIAAGGRNFQFHMERR